MKRFYEELEPIMLAAIRALPTKEELQSRIKAAVDRAIKEARMKEAHLR